jgi:hypothetical protein
VVSYVEDLLWHFLLLLAWNNDPDHAQCNQQRCHKSAGSRVKSCVNGQNKKGQLDRFGYGIPFSFSDTKKEAQQY